MNNCIKCGKPTQDKTRVKSPTYYVSICRSHKAEVLADRDILDANKKFVYDRRVANDESLPDSVKDLLKNKVNKSPTFSVYANYLSKREVKLLTEEDLVKHDELMKKKAENEQHNGQEEFL